MALTPGTRIGFYEITARIGVGGMGEVYRATDTNLARQVAIKVLPGNMAADAERLARFDREAKTLAALNHPNIAAIYGLEDAGGSKAIVMELVEGQTLADRIAEDQISVDEAISIGAQIAEAIEAAHTQGIVHRDLKPANVIISRDRRVKVLDFGLAKTSRAGQDDDAFTTLGETQPGVILGTPAYMSPEQIAGARVDHLTDIFSLGIILYEMMTGHRPFRGKTQMELAASIMRDQPPRILRPDAPDRLVAAIEQCLVKSACDRTPSAGSLATTLRAIRSSSTPVAGERSKDEGFWVAVLPFKSAGASPEITALAEGLTEGIAVGLSRFSYFRVLTKGLSGARYAIEGSLRQSGGQLRVAVRLIDASTGANVWAENYTRSYSPDTVFETQDSLVPTIVSTIAETNGVLAHTMWIGLRDRDPTGLTPYEALLRSFGYMEHLTPEEHHLALVGLKHALDQQPRHAGCLAMLAIVYADGYLLGYGTEKDQAEKAVGYGRRAVAAEPSDHFAHYALAFACMSRKDVPAFHRAAERALALNPLDGGAMAGIAMFTAFLGDWQRGCELMQRAMTLNPRHPGWYWFPFVADAYRRKEYSKALDYALRLNLPGFFHTHVWFAAAHGQLGNRAEAAEALRELNALYPDFGSHARHELGKWLAESALVEHWLEGLRKAGLAITEGGPAAVASDR